VAGTEPIDIFRGEDFTVDEEDEAKAVERLSVGLDQMLTPLQRMGQRYRRHLVEQAYERKRRARQ
jgi:hypothetical protein